MKEASLCIQHYVAYKKHHTPRNFASYFTAILSYDGEYSMHKKSLCVQPGNWSFRMMRDTRLGRWFETVETWFVPCLNSMLGPYH